METLKDLFINGSKKCGHDTLCPWSLMLDKRLGWTHLYTKYTLRYGFCQNVNPSISDELSSFKEKVLQEDHRPTAFLLNIMIKKSTTVNWTNKYFGL